MQRPIAAVIMLATSTMLVSLAPFLIEGHVGYSAEVQLAALSILIVSAAGMIRSVLQSDRGLADLFFWFYFLYIFAFPAVLQASAGAFPWPYPVNGDAAILTAFATNLFLVAYLFGSHGNAVARRPASRANAFNLLIFTLLSIGIGALAVIVVGPTLLLSSRDQLSMAINDKALAYPLFVGRGFVLVALLLNLGAWRGADTDRFIGSVSVLASLALVVLLFNPLATARFQFLGALVAVLVVLIGKPTPVLKASILLGMTFALFFAFASIKGLASTGSFDVTTLDDLKRTIFRVDYDSFQLSVAITDYVRQEGYSWGHNLASAVLFFVPRPLWPGKADPTGDVVTKYLGWDYTNVSSPLPMEFYLAFGLIGVLAGGALVGRAVNKIELLGGGAGHYGYSKYVLALVAGFMTIMLRGSMVTALAQVGVAFIALWIAQLMGVMTRTRAGRAEALVRRPLTRVQRL